MKIVALLNMIVKHSTLSCTKFLLSGLTADVYNDLTILLLVSAETDSLISLLIRNPKSGHCSLRVYHFKYDLKSNTTLFSCCLC